MHAATASAPRLASSPMTSTYRPATDRDAVDQLVEMMRRRRPDPIWWNDDSIRAPQRSGYTGLVIVKRAPSSLTRRTDPLRPGTHRLGDVDPRQRRLGLTSSQARR